MSHFITVSTSHLYLYVIITDVENHDNLKKIFIDIIQQVLSLFDIVQS